MNMEGIKEQMQRELLEETDMSNDFAEEAALDFADMASLWTEVVDQEFFIPEEKRQLALNAVKKCLQQHPEWTGIDFEGAMHADNLYDFMQCLGWDFNTNDYDVGTNMIEFERSDDTDNLAFGHEDILFDALAPYVDSGSYLEMWVGNRECWRWVFDGERCKRIKPIWK